MNLDRINSAERFLSCDWGTSSFRLHLVEGSTGRPLADYSDSDGIKRVYNRWSEQRDPEDQKSYMLKTLKSKVYQLSEASGIDLRGMPLLLSGMASSSIGLEELPYAELPFSLKAPELITRLTPASDSFPYMLVLVSGIRAEHDVMRGEEVQLLGLSERYDLENDLCILPGTHSKHLHLKGGRLIDFSTYMTGELFELISKESILRDALSTTGTEGPESRSAFLKGVETALDENLLHSLFTIRADLLLYNSDRFLNHHFLSGVLIGSELGVLQKRAPSRTILAGAKQLQPYYSAALERIGIDYISDDPEVDLTLLGHITLLRR